MITHDCQQGSPEWIALRLGVVTASEMDALVSPKGKCRTGNGVDTYLYKKICEKLLGPAVSGSSYATEQGLEMEPDARKWYSFVNDVDVKTVGFCTTDDGRTGCSPDGLIGEDGGLEIKCFQREHGVRCILERTIPEEYILQVQTSLFVTNRLWWDFLIYSKDWPSFVIRSVPDPTLQEAISNATVAFKSRFDEALVKIKAMSPEAP